MDKKYILMLIMAVAIVPVSVFAVDQTDIEIAAKKQLETMITKIQEDIDKSTVQEEIERLEKLLAGAQDLKTVVDIGDQLKTASDDEKAQLEAQLATKIEDLKEHAGDRYTYTNITDVESDQDSNNPSGEASTQSAWPPQAYASNDLTDFEFEKINYGDCGNFRYSMELSGIIDSGDNDISLDWAFPSRMYVDNKDDDVWGNCIFVDFQRAELSHFGIDSDGIYYCGALIPGYHIGADTYPCSYVDSGEVNVLSSFTKYVDDDSDNDRTIHLDPIIRILILN